jgi:cobaltochelatase CobS
MSDNDKLASQVVDAIRKAHTGNTVTPEAKGESMFEESAEAAVLDENQMLLSTRMKELGASGFKIPKGKDIPITVYPDDHWGEYASFIPKFDENYIWDTDLLIDFLRALERGDNIFISGPTGTGKTMGSRNLAALRNKPWIRINGHEEMTGDEITGTMAVVQGDNGVETPFVPGALTVAMMSGADFCLDEPTQIPPSVAMVLQAPLEGMPLVITTGNDSFANRVIQPHPDFTFICCDNSTGTGDESGLYAGCKVWNIATLDRFETSLFMDYLPKSREKIMLKKVYPSIKDVLADRLIEFSRRIRKSHVKGDLQLTMSARGLLNTAGKCLEYQDVSKAVRLSFFNKFGNGAEKEAVSSIFFDVFAQTL